MPPVSSRTTIRSTPFSTSGRRVELCSMPSNIMAGRRLANRPSSFRSLKRAFSGRSSGGLSSQRAPPTAPRSTASESRQRVKVSGGSGFPTRSIAPPPTMPNWNVNRYPKVSATARRTLTPSSTISGPIPSPGRTAIFLAMVSSPLYRTFESVRISPLLSQGNAHLFFLCGRLFPPALDQPVDAVDIGPCTGFQDVRAHPSPLNGDPSLAHQHIHLAEGILAACDGHDLAVHQFHLFADDAVDRLEDGVEGTVAAGRLLQPFTRLGISQPEGRSGNRLIAVGELHPLQCIQFFRLRFSPLFLHQRDQILIGDLLFPIGHLLEAGEQLV